jgi:hypothetical protein
LACFCNKYTIGYGDENIDTLYNPDYKWDVLGEEKRLCKAWGFGNWFGGLLIMNGVKYFIIVMNLVVRIMIMNIAPKMGLPNHSKRQDWIKNWVYIACIFMTGFLSILCCWDFSRWDVKIVTSAFGGIYSEF